MSEPQPASSFTRAHNHAVGDALQLDPDDFTRASRGLLREGPRTITNGWGLPVWDLDQYAFCAGEAPDTVNPSLWRQSQLNLNSGLFEVCDGIYQVRGIDLANITFVRGNTGWIVIDPLSAAETAAAALELIHSHFEARPIVAVIYTHSHVDHFAGVRGVITDDDVQSGRVQVIAPAGFMTAAVSENVFAGPAMVRRAMYMYGPLLDKGVTGQVDAGLGKAIPLLPSTGLIAPTIDIETTGEEMTIDGVRIVFQVTPDTEAPAEMNFYFPDFRALCMAENCCGTMHNLYTPRGAQIRDALAWSKYIDEAITLHADESDVVFASHHWPRFGREDGLRFLEIQRDLYRFLHDQTLRLANHGLIGSEIAEVLELPKPFVDEASTRGYYGTVSHNAKAVYQKYLGWFDGNPAHLNPLPPVEAGQKYVQLMGGADEVVRRCRPLFENGEYRFVAEVLNHVIFAEPEHAEARALQADTLEQMGYQAESAVWRNFYLQGARELRHGVLPMGSLKLSNPDVAKSMTLDMLLDLVGVRLDAGRLGDARAVIAIEIPERDEARTLWFENRAIHHRPGMSSDATITVTGSHEAISGLCTGDIQVANLSDRDDLTIIGDRDQVIELWSCLDAFELGWGVVTP